MFPTCPGQVKLTCRMGVYLTSEWGCTYVRSALLFTPDRRAKNHPIVDSCTLLVRGRNNPDAYGIRNNGGRGRSQAFWGPAPAHRPGPGLSQQACNSNP